MKVLFDLFITFMKIGGFTIGGGYAMIPVIQSQIVDKKGWITEEEMTDFIIIGQSVPGVVSINCATAVGNRVAGKLGAAAATAGIVMPSLAVIMLIACFFDAFLKFELIQKAFNGMRGAVVALIFAAVIRLVRTSVKNFFHAVIGLIAAIGIIFFNISPPYMLVLAALSSVIYSRSTETGGGKS